MIKKLLILLIETYQKTISPDHSWFKHRHPNGYCRYYPSCSEYAKQSLQKYGAGKGTVRAIWRILRCNPWSKGGFDPVN